MFLIYKFRLLAFRRSLSFVLGALCIPTCLLYAEVSQLHSLARSPTWLRLLHYQDALFPWVDSHSHIVGKGFFLSPTGRNDPLAELEQTLYALRDPKHRIGADQQAALCLFPARAQFLARELKEDFPTVACPYLEQWMQALAPERASIIFASAYSSNPASLFGHTMLRIDSANSAQLLSYTIHYAAANNPNDNPFAYVIKGLTGGYAGFYMLSPYHDLITLYADGESRDLWEYPLALSQEQVRFLCLHLWELLNAAWSPYWFFDENCSHALLALLEVARPDLRLLQHFSGVVVPLETLRSLQDEGLIQERPKRRPSRKADSLAWLQALSFFDQAKAFAATRVVQEPTSLSTPVLDGAMAILDYRKMKNHGILTASESTNVPLLKAERARRPVDDSTLQIREAKAPDTQVPPQKLRTGVRRQEQEYSLLLAYTYGRHAQMDPSAGHEPWESIEYMGVGLELDHDLVRLDSVTLFDIQSLSPWTLLDPRPAWRAYVGAHRIENLIVPELSANIGIAMAPWEREWALLVYALSGLRIFPSNRHWQHQSGVSALIASIVDLGRLRLQMSTEVLFAPWASESKYYRSWMGEMQWDMTKNFSLDLKHQFDSLEKIHWWQLQSVFRF